MNSCDATRLLVILSPGARHWLRWRPFLNCRPLPALATSAVAVSDSFDLEQGLAAGIVSGDVRDPPVVNFYLLFMHLEHAPLSGEQLLEQRAQPLLGGLEQRGQSPM